MKSRQEAISKYLSGESDCQAEASLVGLLTYRRDTKTSEEPGTSHVSALVLQRGTARTASTGKQRPAKRARERLDDTVSKYF